MAAYLIADVDVTDAAVFEEYRREVPASEAPFGGHYLARGGATKVLEGDWEPGRIVVLEFPSLEKAKAWWSSSGYAPAKAIRQSSSETRMIVVEGFE